MGFPAKNAGTVVYKEWRRLVKSLLVARNFTVLINFAIGELQLIVPGIRRLRPVCDQLTTELCANNMACIREADEAIVQLVKDSMSKLTTTMNKQLQVVAKGQPAPALGQPGVSIEQVIDPPRYYLWEPEFNGVLLWLIRTHLPFPKTLSRRLTNRKGKGKLFQVPFRCKHKLFLVSFWGNLNRKRKDELFLSFWPNEKLVPVSFWVNLKLKHHDKSFLSFQRRG